MELRALGSSGLEVSRIGLGTMTWGRDTDIHEARDLTNIYAEAGGNLIDTADVYGDGAAETLVGEISRDFPELLISTKAGAVRTDRRVNLSRKHLLDSLDNSLKRLRRTNVDIWQLHGWDPNTALAETCGALTHAVNSGRVQYVGVTGQQAWQMSSVLAELPKNTVRLISASHEYSLLNRQVEVQELPAANFHGVGFMAWSPLGRGVLTGKYRFNTPPDSRAASSHLANFVKPYLTDRTKSIIEAVSTAAEGLGVAPMNVALSWVLANPNVTTAIIGPRTAAQLRALLANLDTVLPDQLYQALTEVSY